MEALLDYLQTNRPDMKLVLITPPPLDIPELPGIDKKMAALIAAYRDLAENRNIGYIDTNSWDIPLAYDGAHLSQKRHHIFAENIERELKNSLTSKV